MTDADRQHLAKILGMLGSPHAGERAAAGLQAEAFRKKHGLAWAELVAGQTVYRDREVIVEKPVYYDREVVVEKIVERFVHVGAFYKLRQQFRVYGCFDRGAAIALGSIPLIIVAASIAPKIRAALGY
jgi:hypothetical protein